MQKKQVPFIVSSIFQLIKLVFIFFTLLLYLNKTADSIINSLFFGGDSLSLAIILLSGEFAVFAALLSGILYPDKLIKTDFLIKVIKFFSIIGFFILLVFSVISRIKAAGADYEILIVLNRKIFLLIALIFIDFAVLFVLILYKGEFEKKADAVQQTNYPEFTETNLEE